MFSFVVKVVALIALVSADEPAQSRVYGGHHAIPVDVDPYTGFQTATNTGEYPYIVSLEVNGHHSCGGALLKDDVVLTAAHCTEGIPASMLQIRAGIVVRGQSNAGAQVQKVKFYVNHEGYSKDTIRNDVALIKLQGKFNLNQFVGLATLPNQGQSFVGQTALMLGWGEDESAQLSAILKKANTGIISNTECSQRMGRIIPDVMLCGYDKTHRLRGVCSGDSGGPVVVGKNTVIGVNSWVIKGEKYCNTQYPSVFANVAVLKSWITKQMASRF